MTKTVWEQDMALDRVRITLGVDFGTSMTKVAFRVFGEQNAVVVPFSGQTHFWPSELHVSNHSLHFGNCPEQAEVSVHWLKILLAEGRQEHLSSERREMLRRLESLGLDVQRGATLFLAYVVGTAIASVRRRFSDFHPDQLEITCNLSAPLETFAGTRNEDDERRADVQERFDAVFHHAFFLAKSGKIAQGMNLGDAQHLLAQIREAHAYPPLADDRRTFIIPEIHAAVAGVVQSHQLEPGNCAVVDVGAGTTDVAVFLYSQDVRRNGRRAIAYFGDRVKHAASSDLDTLLAKAIRRLCPPAVELADDALRLMVRLAKEKSSDGSIKCSEDLALGRDQASLAVSEVIDIVHDHYGKTVISSLLHKYRRAMSMPFNLILLGGGTRYPLLYSRLNEDPPDGIYPKLRAMPSDFSFGDRLTVLQGDSHSTIAGREAHMLALAYGLTTHMVRVPEFWSPAEVEDDAPVDTPCDVWIRDDDD